MENNKICQSCGAISGKDASFCYNCGTPFPALDQVNPMSTVVNQTPVADMNAAPVPPVNQVNNTENTTPTNETSQAPVESSNDSKNAKIFGIVSLVLFFASSLLAGIILPLLPEITRNSFSVFFTFGPLIGIVLVIIGRVTYPLNKFLKVVSWIIFGTIIATILFYVLMIVMCYATCVGGGFPG